MRVNDLKNNIDYEFSCNISEVDFINEKYYDEWGAAFINYGNIGVEYNICKELTRDYSAIYSMCCDSTNEKWETDCNNYLHYEIDFLNDNWESDLENAMCDALIKLFNL